MRNYIHNSYAKGHRHTYGVTTYFDLFVVCSCVENVSKYVKLKSHLIEEKKAPIWKKNDKISFIMSRTSFVQSQEFPTLLRWR